MKTADSHPYPALMTIADAARVAGRSLSWVRRYRTFGPLVPRMLDGQQAVTTRSLLALLASYEGRRGSAQRVHLRLVVDNSK